MSNDLLFSVLPRRGTVPIKEDRGNVKKVVKKTPIHPSPDEENVSLVREKDARDENQHGHQESRGSSDEQQESKDYSDEHVGLIIDTTDENIAADDEPIIHNKKEYLHDASTHEKEDNEPDEGEHLDITV
ncbi:hypothetical protein [Alteromonas flava]|uniref:hypothetical protein n=1 Tax=Alteromonas flava TaxID=2048003 RepID=UPI000C29234D|nr:hypothetical protein [Alteromonas flava]